MKYCLKCGIQSEDNAVLCASCGAAFEGQQDAVKNEGINTVEAPDANQYYAQYRQSVPSFAQNPTIAALKRAGSSTVFFIAVILYSVQILLSLIHAFIREPVSNTDIYSEFNEEIGVQFEKIQDALSTFALVVSIPTILICIGMWLFYASSRSRYDGPLPTTGLTMIKVINFIFLGFLLLFPFLVFLTVLFGNVDTEESSAVLIAIIAIIIFAIVLTLPVIYIIGIINTINTLKKTIKTGMPSDKVSGFVGVMNFIIAVFFILTALAAIRTLDIVAIFSNLLSAAFFILISIGLFAYKKEMSLIIYKNYYSASVSTYTPFV
ncbi:MAG: hypothetical protein CVU97_02420 [Firmicutes bacterium HGW-Firmicutes-21]|nr:MAG: hypothetical protein CVU97_02420 [Firmicutes bacterium HGW-Firmicutes-21]